MNQTTSSAEPREQLSIYMDIYARCRESKDVDGMRAALDHAETLITNKAIEARLDELNRAAFVLNSTLADDVDALLDHTDVQAAIESYQKLRAIELQANKDKGEQA